VRITVGSRELPACDKRNNNNNNNNNNNVAEEITPHVTQTVNTEQLQHLYPRSMVCFRYIIVK
jgi:hypothetical protein